MWHLFSHIVFCYIRWEDCFVLLCVFSKKEGDDRLNRAICASTPGGFDESITEMFLIVTPWLWRLLLLRVTKAWRSSRQKKSTSHLGWPFSAWDFCWGAWVSVGVLPSFLYILFCCVMYAFKIYLKLSRAHRLEWNPNITKQQKRPAYKRWQIFCSNLFTLGREKSKTNWLPQSIFLGGCCMLYVLHTLPV